MNQRIRSAARSLGRVPAGWWVALFILPALLPLMRPGFFESHDGLFHVYRLAALDHAVRAGVVLPRWFPGFAFGYGHPVLNFYGPLSYYWGLPFTLVGMPAASALKLVFAAGLIGSGLAMYLFARVHFERLPALVAAVIYAYLPYHLVDLYVRGALAEFLAFVWFPLILWAFHRLAAEPKPRSLGLVALASLLLAALVTTHSLSSLIFAPVLVGYVILVSWQHRKLGGLTGVALSIALAVGISAFYWLPVLAESQFVGLGHGVSQGYRDHLLSLTRIFVLDATYAYPTEADSVPSFTLGWVQIAISVMALALAFSRRVQRWPLIFFLVVLFVSGFMLTTASLPVWRVFETGLAYLQYPWRFHALGVLAAAFLAGGIINGLTRPGAFGRVILAILLVVVTGAWALWGLPVRPMTVDPTLQAMWQQDKDHGQVGATWTGEYLPIWVEEQRWAISHPATEPYDGDRAFPAGLLNLESVRYTGYDMTLNSDQSTRLVLHQFHYPGWQAGWQAGKIPSQPAGVLGLASFELGPGSGPLTTRLGLGPAQSGGTWFSLVVAVALGLALVVLPALTRRGDREGKLVVRDKSPGGLPAVVCLVLAVLLLSSLVWPNGSAQALTQINANLDHSIELLASEVGQERIFPGDTVPVTLYWLALRGLEQDYKSFVHMTDGAVTSQPAQHDGDPGGGFSPTTRWLPGEVVPDTHHVALPATLPPGSYLLWAGMYEHPAIRDLPVLESGAPTAGNRILVGRIEVLSR